jgi:hypothetical protein
MAKIIVVLILILLFFTGAAWISSGRGQDMDQRFSLDNVPGINTALFSVAQKDLLRQNGFVAAPAKGDIKDIHEIYTQARERNQPLFITTDAMLHTAHIFFDYMLRILEIEKMYDHARELTDHMLRLSKEQFNETEPGPVKEAARLNIGFFSVPKKIFDTSYQPGNEVDTLVRRELGHIEEHQGLAFRELLAYVDSPSLLETPYAYEDYSQYVPRGHYTRNEKFRKYFKVMMWYGRLDFKLQPGKKEQAVRHGQHMTIQALLMADALMRDPDARRLWEKIYEPTTFFVGKTDDLHPPDYMELIRSVYPQDAPVSRYADLSRLATFTQKAAKMRQPRILSGAEVDGRDEFPSTTQGFRFMGQRFIPDSAIFQQLVFHAEDGEMRLKYTGSGDPFTKENIQGVGPVRAWPRGLDMMAVLGSDRAQQILEEDGDTDYTHYNDQVQKLKRELALLHPEDWTQNLYWSWLHSLRPLLDNETAEGAPAFMLTQAWMDKALMTALGSWTELRHDTILYAKQSYTMVGASMPPRPQLTHGYVEPYPRVYTRLCNMMLDLREIVSQLKLSVPEVPKKIGEFEAILSRLAAISEKELNQRALTREEYTFIWNMGRTLAGLKQFPADIMEKITSNADEQMDVIADVHTDLNTSQVLEEGVGLPFDIYVIIGDGPDRRLCRGAVFSYYEFKWPLDDRLTDEAWQKMEAAEKRPDLPGWTQSFIVR